MALNEKVEKQKRELALKRAEKHNTKAMVPSKKPTLTLDMSMSINELYYITGYTLLMNNKGQVWTPHNKQFDKHGINCTNHAFGSHMHIFYDTFLSWMEKNNYSLTDSDAILKMEELANSNNYFYVIIWPDNANYRIAVDKSKEVIIRNVNGLGNPKPLYKKLKRMSKNDELPPPGFRPHKTNALGHGTSIYDPYNVIIDTGRDRFFR